MQEHTVLDLTPLRIDLYASNRHFVPFVRCCAAFIKIPAFEYVSFLPFREIRNVILILVSYRCSLSDQTAFVDTMFRAVLNKVVVTIYIVPVKITDLVLLSVIYVIEVIKHWIITCRPVLDRAVPVLSFFANKLEPCVLWFVLVCNICIAGSNLHNTILIVSFSIIDFCWLSGIVFPLDRFIPDMVSPVIERIAWETHEYKVAICVVRFAQNVLIHDRNDTFDRAGARSGRTWFQSRSNHHDIADRLIVIRSDYFIVCRPLRTYVFSVVSLHNKVIISSSSNTLRLNGISCYRWMLIARSMPCDNVI